MKWLREDGSLQRFGRIERDNTESRPRKQETIEGKTIQLDRRKRKSNTIRELLCPAPGESQLFCDDLANPSYQSHPPVCVSSSTEAGTLRTVAYYLTSHFFPISQPDSASVRQVFQFRTDFYALCSLYMLTTTRIFTAASYSNIILLLPFQFSKRIFF